MDVNIVSKDLGNGSSPPPPTKTDSSIKIKELELALLDSFMGDSNQKTDISPQERLMLSSLLFISTDPFPSARIKNNQPEGSYRIDFLEKWIRDYIRFGIPMGRKGRSEEVKVLSAYFAGQNELNNQNQINTKLLK